MRDYFSVSRETIVVSKLLIVVNRLISLHVLLDECLSFIKPVCSGCIIRGVIFYSLLAGALQIILRSTFVSDVGR